MLSKPFEDVWKAVSDPANGSIPNYHPGFKIDPVFGQLLSSEKTKKVLVALGIYSIKRIRLNTKEHQWSIVFVDGTTKMYSRDVSAFNQKDSLKDVFVEIERIK